MCFKGDPFRPHCLDPGNSRKHMGCNFLKEIILSLGFRQNFLQGSFWLSVVFIDSQQLRSSARREESKHGLLESSLRKTQ